MGNFTIPVSALAAVDHFEISAAGIYRATKTSPNGCDLQEGDLNPTGGYEVAQQKTFDEALEASKLNVEMYVNSCSAYDSLAKATSTQPRERSCRPELRKMPATRAHKPKRHSHPEKNKNHR
jgi:hypothetical protein